MTQNTQNIQLATRPSLALRAFPSAMRYNLASPNPAIGSIGLELTSWAPQPAAPAPVEPSFHQVALPLLMQLRSQLECQGLKGAAASALRLQLGWGRPNALPYLTAGSALNLPAIRKGQPVVVHVTLRRK